MNILEYMLPSKDFKNSKEHNDFRKKIEEIVSRSEKEIVNHKNIETNITIIYGKKLKDNRIFKYNYDKKQFSDNDDAYISVIMAGINRILADDYPNGKIIDTPFAIQLCFGKNPYIEYPEIDTQSKQSDRETLNIIPVKPKFTFDNMILSESAENELKDVVALVSLRKKIYEEWGFSEVDPVPRAVINFFGPPGTGKTMAAHALASEFGINILVLNYADIESKYVGDAPKNLMQAFNIAKEHNALLFFDEADSFLGKRITNVTQSADQAVNSLRSQLLMLLEDFKGTVVFATNLIENYDKAFKSRIIKHIKFELPNEELRKNLILKMIPSKTPRKSEEFSDSDLQELVNISDGFSGREIKNAVLNGITSSAKSKEYFSFDDAKNAFEEVKKSINHTNTKNKGDDFKERMSNKIRKFLCKRKNKKCRGVLQHNKTSCKTRDKKFNIVNASLR